LQRKIIQIQDKVPLSQWFPLSIQHLFAMFGASIYVPIFFGIDPGIVLVMNGIGTFIFIWMTKGKAPAFLGSSFAFLSPTAAVIANGVAMGYPHDQAFAIAQGGFVVVGLVGIIVAIIIWKFGTNWIKVVMPPAAMGPVVALIGLELAGTAAAGAGLLPAAGTAINPANVWVFLITLCVAVFGSVCFRKFFAVIPILISIFVGYIAAMCFGLVDFSPIGNATWFALPHVQLPIFDIGAILTILPAILVITTEHIGHQLVTSEVVGKDLIKDPGLHRSMLGDHISTTISALVGAVPTTTYGENIGVMAVTKVYSVRVIGGAALISIIIAFIGKFTAFINTIPGAVIGGIAILLYGMIAASGIRVMVDSKVDFSKSRNLVLTAVIFVIGLSGLSINIGTMTLKGMVLAALLGMVLSLIFYILDKLNLTNDKEEDIAGETADK
jgi:uracil permease